MILNKKKILPYSYTDALFFCHERYAGEKKRNKNHKGKCGTEIDI